MPIAYRQLRHAASVLYPRLGQTDGQIAVSLNAPLMAGHIIFYGPVSVPHVAVRAVVLINSVKRMHRQFGKRSEQ